MDIAPQFRPPFRLLVNTLLSPNASKLETLSLSNAVRYDEDDDEQHHVTREHLCNLMFFHFEGSAHEALQLAQRVRIPMLIEGVDISLHDSPSPVGSSESNILADLVHHLGKL